MGKKHGNKICLSSEGRVFRGGERMIEIIWKLLAAHAVTDCLLQDRKISAVADNKRRFKLGHVTGPGHNSDWMYWLWSHGCLNGIGVYLATGNAWCALAESILHSVIDFGKCERFYGLHTDQFLHFLCKLSYVWFLTR